MSNSSFSSGYDVGMKSTHSNLANQKLLDDQYKNLGDRLTEAMGEPDETMRSVAVDSLLRGAEQLTGRPMSKEFRTFLKQSPEDAATVFKNIQDRGISPEVVFRVQDNPLLFGHAMLALGKAKRERMARLQRGGEAGETPAASGSSVPSDQPEQLSGPGVDEAAAATPQAAPASAVASPQASSPIDAETAKVQNRVAVLGKRIDALASMGRPEVEISPLRTERSTLEKELRDINIGPAMTKRNETAKLSAQPVGREDVALGVEAATRAQRPDLAIRFKPGMPRDAFDALTAEMGTPQTQAVQAPAPTTSSASPIAAPVPAVDAGAAAPVSPVIPGAKPAATLVQTPAESLTERQDIERRARALDKDVLRDPAVIKAGVRTQGELEDAIAKGTVKLQDLSQIARAGALAEGQAKGTVKDFDTLKDEGMHARKVGRYYDILAAAGEKAGPRGPWLTPLRESANNFANLLGIKDPWKQSNMQLMESVSNKLIPELTMQFKGSQSDREFLAGLASAPSVKNTEKGFAMLLYTAREVNNITLEQDLQARKWVGKYGSLDATDAKGNDFSTAFDVSLEAFEKKNGTLQDRIGKAFKVKPADLLKGKP